MKVNKLIWDDWNKNHIRKHGVGIVDVEVACWQKNKAKKSFRERLILTGKTLGGKKIKIVLSPEDKEGKRYEKGEYYVITAYFEEVNCE